MGCAPPMYASARAVSMPVEPWSVWTEKLLSGLLAG